MQILKVLFSQTFRQSWKKYTRATEYPLCLPQNNALSRIKNLGQHCKGGWVNLVYFLGTSPIIFFHDCTCKALDVNLAIFWLISVSMGKGDRLASLLHY